MSKTLFQTLPNPAGQFATVKKNDCGEYVARMFNLDRVGIARHYIPADSFESDLESACFTAAHMIHGAAMFSPAAWEACT